MPTTSRQLLYNPFDPALREDPYPIYRRLRDLDPIHRSPLGFWALSRYTDIVTVQRDTSLTLIPQRIMARLEEAVGDPSTTSAKVSRWLLESGSRFTQGPEHHRFRALMNPFLGPRAVPRLRGLIEDEVGRLLDQMSTSRPVDFVAEFANPLPINLLTTWLGVPTEDRERCRRWAASIARVLFSNLDLGLLQTMGGTILECDAYFREQLAKRRHEPREDLLSALVEVEADGEGITEDELVANVTVILGVTYEATVNMLGNAILTLVRHPEQLMLLRSDSSLLTLAVQELVRYDSPAQLQRRFTVEDYEIEGTTIPAGSRLVMLLGSANRDPEWFPDPDRLDITRDDARPLSFGGGPHYCIGAALARLEAEIAVSMLLGRFAELGPIVGPLDWRSEPIAIRGLAALPVEVSTT